VSRYRLERLLPMAADCSFDRVSLSDKIAESERALLTSCSRVAYRDVVEVTRGNR